MLERIAVAQMRRVAELAKAARDAWDQMLTHVSDPSRTIRRPPWASIRCRALPDAIATLPAAPGMSCARWR